VCALLLSPGRDLRLTSRRAHPLPRFLVLATPPCCPIFPWRFGARSRLVPRETFHVHGICPPVACQANGFLRGFLADRTTEVDILRCRETGLERFFGRPFELEGGDKKNGTSLPLPRFYALNGRLNSAESSSFPLNAADIPGTTETWRSNKGMHCMQHTLQRVASCWILISSQESRIFYSPTCPPLCNIHEYLFMLSLSLSLSLSPRSTSLFKYISRFIREQL
jgi:hypothetical protein